MNKRTFKPYDHAAGTELISIGQLEEWEKAHRAAAARTVAELGAGTKRITFEDKTTYKVGQLTLGGYFDAVICGHAPLRTYYQKAWTKGSEPQAPICWATAGVDPIDGLPVCDEKQLAPAAGVTDRQADHCSECKHSRLGTALNGGKGQACRRHIRIAVLVLGGEVIGAFEQPNQALICTITIPPTSVDGFRDYMRMLENKADVPYYSVITRVSLDDDSNWALPIFAPIGMVQPAFKERAKDLVEKAPALVTSSPWPLKVVE